MELIYIQTRLKGQGSHELALEIRKKERKIEQLAQTHTIVFISAFLVLIDTGDYDSKS